MSLKKEIKCIIKKIIPYNIYKKLKMIYLTKISKRFYFEVQLVDHCNLNCIGCSHFSPIADHSFIDVDEYEKDCNAFARLARNHVHSICLMGGEPLLHKEISRIIRITRSNFTKSVIRIATNGILLDQMGADFWNACKSNNIFIVITPYPINLNLKKIRALSREYGVRVKGVNTKNKDKTKYKTKFMKNVYDPVGLQVEWDNFEKCDKKRCHHLHNGKFYMCPPPVFIKYINQHFTKNFQVTTADYIDIHQIHDIKPVLEYIKKPIPFCRYCNINATNYNVAWSISKKESSEWL